MTIVSPRTLRALLACFTLGLAACNNGGGSSGGGGGSSNDCPAGTAGCACATGDRCGKADNGEQLLCQGGICEAMQCPAGDPGCVCRNGLRCNDVASTCKEGFCVAANCSPGQKNCTCLAGACDPGFACVDDKVCVESKGYEGGGCLDTGRCYRGNRCDTSTGLCVHCDPGSAGCACGTNDSCNAGLACNAGLCMSASQLPPANPKCYTGCRDDLTLSDGGTVVCGPDHTLPGCLPGLVCTQGSCLNPGEMKPTCTSDLTCPFFQVCLAGGCYSNCETNADCQSGMGCDRHACRPSCVLSGGQGTCPSGTACTSNDGQNGFCTPVGTASSAVTPTPSGGFKLPVKLLALSNVATTADFMIVTDSTNVQDVTVRKLWHSSTDKNGVTERIDAPQLDGGFLPCDPIKGECPLQWLTLTAPGGSAVQSPAVSYRLLPGCADTVSDPDAGTPCPTIHVGGAGDTAAVKWEGELLITTKDSSDRVHLTYVQRPDGQWTGSMFYFGDFSNIGLDNWIASPNKEQVTNVNNGLLQRWGALRLGNLNGWDEFLAVLTSTREGSWKFSNVQQRCSTLGVAGAACYPYTNTVGVRAYVTNPVQYPIPSGVSELPVAMNLKINATTPTVFEGRIASSLAMHYPGNPAVKLKFKGDPSLGTSCFNGGASDCLMFLEDINTVPADTNRLVASVGGRYISGDGNCGTGYVAANLPWLVPAFNTGAHQLQSGGPFIRTECRDAELPFDVGQATTNSAVNQSLAGGNPVPDGYPRQRTLRFLDGALVNQSELFILFEESYSSFIPGQAPTKAYGYMRLKRAAANLTSADYVGLTGPTSTTKTPPIGQGAQCDAQLLQDMFPGVINIDKRALVDKLLAGTNAAAGYSTIPANTGVHYYCEDTGLFNGGQADTGPNGIKVACPAGSKVTFFNVCSGAGTGCNKTAADIANEACQKSYVPDTDGRSCTANNECHSGMCSGGQCVRGTCGNTLTSWKSNGVTITEGGSDAEALVSQCLSPGDVYCDDNRFDLRAGRQFFRKTAATGKSFLPLPTLIETAFRYKTRFRSSVSGTTLGFAPVQCVPNSDAKPYCYDPAQIEEARMRVDCLVNVYSDNTFMASIQGAGDATRRANLLTFLQQNFSQLTNNHDGFERLYAELMIMQGDEALTSAYASRFDLAAAGGASFKGSAFEPNGIDLTGVAGAEMYSLYQAVQYYQLALDRLYMLGPNMNTALARGNVGTDPNFITPAMVTSYLERLVRAASQKSRAWGEVARRYQNFNRPDLARRVIERAYVSTYLESALISRLMVDIAEKSATATLPQLRLTIEKTQRNYRMALLDMREVYQGITDQVNYFGFPPDYIPFPALDASSVSSSNAYEVLSVIAKQRLDLAKTREQTALTFGKQGKVDAAQFQSDLTSIRNTYENQLANLCGTFIGDDGRAYPAIKKYAPLKAQATLMSDPCGRMGNGDLHNAMAAVKDSGLKLQGVLLKHENLLKEIDIERARAAQQCGITQKLADYVYTNAGTAFDMQKKIEEQRALTGFISGSVKAVIDSIGVLDCEIQCASSVAMAATVAAAGVAAAGTQYASELRIADQERELKDFDRNSVRATTLSQCDATNVDSSARIANLFNDTLEVQLEALRAEYGIRLAMADVQKLTSNAQRLQAQQEETEQLSIDVQAAQNDPNVRIYQNDAVINADLSFNQALAAAYRLTRVYEYYTSQSYAKKEQLFLIRMVTAGQYNLENYLLELDNNFQTFEEQFGNPDVRVLALSLKDDIFKIPYLDEKKKTLDEDVRVKMMRDRLKDVSLLDSHGYLTIPFSTNMKALSPLTRNHKIRHVEVDLQGVRMGDAVARVYLRMSGTGVVRNVQDDIDYYVFPSRLGVINASILGSKVFDPEVYRNYRFRDRPLVNTLWELVINQRDELANKDIDLQTLTDLRILVYYSDLTSF
ncbi:MAG: hypothetical protein K1X89_03365 [Myxococcaceae bacterium]|nr:hypothetical protein [Myxococcaceae bacterium]